MGGPTGCVLVSYIDILGSLAVFGSDVIVSAEKAHMMIKRLLSRCRRILKRISSNRGATREIQKLYDEYDYLEAYSKHSDLRAKADPKSAVGGMWEEIGRLQYDFMTGKGLLSHHRMLDIGCGTLRGGRHFIRYLDHGNYTGIDISPEILKAADRLVDDEGLRVKKPTLLLNENKDLKFGQFEDKTFDYLLAQSVFTHLMPEHIEECFENVGKVMHQESSFFFTFNLSSDLARTGLKSFSYPYSFFSKLADKHGLVIEDCQNDYPHPRRRFSVRDIIDPALYQEHHMVRLIRKTDRSDG